MFSLYTIMLCTSNEHIAHLRASARNSYMQKYAEKDVDAFENCITLYNI